MVSCLTGATCGGAGALCSSGGPARTPFHPYRTSRYGIVQFCLSESNRRGSSRRAKFELFSKRLLVRLSGEAESQSDSSNHTIFPNCIYQSQLLTFLLRKCYCTYQAVKTYRIKKTAHRFCVVRPKKPPSIAVLGQANNHAGATHAERCMSLGRGCPGEHSAAENNVVHVATPFPCVACSSSHRVFGGLLPRGSMTQGGKTRGVSYSTTNTVGDVARHGRESRADSLLLCTVVSCGLRTTLPH